MKPNYKKSTEKHEPISEQKYLEVTLPVEEMSNIAKKACTQIIQEILKGRKEIYQTDVNALYVIADFLRDKIQNVAELASQAIDKKE